MQGKMMLNLITPEYKQLNKQLHQDNERYGTSGILYARDVMDLCFNYETEDVLDYGCGKSTLANNLPFAIKQYDPCIDEHSHEPYPADIVVCTDVLEHIEPECLEDVLYHIGGLTKKVAYLVVANGKAQKTLSDGRNAHLIQQKSGWWHNCISANLDVISYKRKASFVLQDGSLFEEYCFIAEPYHKPKETRNEQV